MNTESLHPLTRREAIRNALLVSLGLSTIPATAGSQHVKKSTESTFVPENDYPFFGYHNEEESKFS